MIVRGLLALALLMAAVSGCASQRPATQVTVLVDAEPLTRGESVRLVISVRGGPAGTDFVDARELTYPAPLHWPYDLVVTPAANDTARLFEVEATAYDAGQRIVTQARVRAGYVRGEARTLHVTLEDACRGILCPEGRACRSGRCVDIVPTPDVDAGRSDGSVDGGPGGCTTHAQCDDGNACNGFEQCRGGTCVDGTRLDCDDHVGCTTDSCNGTACVHTPVDGACTLSSGGHCDLTNDCQYAACDATTCHPTGCQSAACQGTMCVRTFACAMGEACCGGSCVHAGCDDGESCTTDFCDETAGACMHPPRSGPCDDHDACTTGEACNAAGMCTGGGALGCADTNPCTDDRCDTARGCVHDSNAATCDDGNGCTVGDRCGAGACVPGAPMNCADTVACTTDACNAGTCSHTPVENCGAGMHCSATLGCQPIATCDATNCMPTPGMCESATCSGTTCVRVTTCGTGQTCCAGACVTADCADTNPCTDDMCGAGGCVHTNHNRGCDDMNACTTGDHCAGGSCVTTPLDCDDFNDCTNDLCSSGSCVHPFVTGPCDSGSGCTQGDFCAGGLCRTGSFCGGTTYCCNDECIPTGLLCG